MNAAFWRDRPVLVTGASGFLGGWMVRALLEASADVVVLVRDGAPRSMLVRDGLIDRVQVVHGELVDGALMRRTLSEYGIATVFHLAAQSQVRVAKADPVGTLEANVRGTWTLLDATRVACPAAEVVVASSDKAYGSSTRLPYREDHALEGRYPYDVSKSCADLISTMYAMSYGMRVAITRCGNLYGGGDLNFDRSIPGLVRSTLRGEPFIIRSDGRYVRDFLYVKDAVYAYFALAEQLAADPSLAGEAFNFSIEARLTVLEIVGLVLKLMGRTDLAPVIQNTASAEIREQYMASVKARERLGWRPEFGLERGLLETIEWYRSFFAAEALDETVLELAPASA
ncbi:MAG TPA: NAD-dependent epimerase/dehydratase family protein [Longimicrobiales bacterium]|nr:NAD-dependent epimerase/dehydratase family protein [Longimicrobiales bacterium]